MIVPEALQFLMKHINKNQKNIGDFTLTEQSRKNFYQTILSSADYQRCGKNTPDVLCRFAANGKHTFRFFSFSSFKECQEWVDLLNPLGIEALLYNDAAATWYDLDHGLFLSHIAGAPSETRSIKRFNDLESELVDIKKDLGFMESKSSAIEKCCGTCDYWELTEYTDGRCEFFERRGFTIKSGFCIHPIMPETNRFSNNNCNAWTLKSK